MAKEGSAHACARDGLLRPSREVTRVRAARAGVDEDVHKSTLSLIDRKLAASARGFGGFRRQTPPPLPSPEPLSGEFSGLFQPVAQRLGGDGALGGHREGAPVHGALQRIGHGHAPRKTVDEAAREGIPAPVVSTTETGRAATLTCSSP